ncbi:Meckelin [Varanus komodoensis]|nr:Meckelin [Varanus komodoensis]
MLAQRRCTLGVPELLRSVPEPIFYQLFVQFEDEKGNPQLWPVPVVNPAIQASRPASLGSRALRRFFLVDGLSGRRGNLTDAPGSVTLAAELLLSVFLPTNAPGDNPPFLLTVKYAGYPSAGVAQASLRQVLMKTSFVNTGVLIHLLEGGGLSGIRTEVAFSVAYIQDPGTAQQTTDVSNSHGKTVEG